MFDVYTKREGFKKYVMVTITAGNCTDYYYSMCGVINRLKEDGNDIATILKVCMYIRRIESKIKFLKYKF